MNERIKVKRMVEYANDFEYDTLKEVKEKIDRWIETYGEDAIFDIYEPPYDTSRYLALFVWEYETDKEMEYRLKNEAERKARQDEYERKQYETLKVKFGG
jgi:hypothetical protein